MGLTLSEEQRVLQDRILDWVSSPSEQYLAVAGYAGTGKTTLLGATARLLQDTKPHLQLQFLSFTGKASTVLSAKLRAFGLIANRAACSTIHSYMYRYEGLNSRTQQPEFSRKLGDEVTGDLLIVDEASMLSPALTKDLLRLGRPAIFVGDPGQLPPINAPMFQPLVDTKLRLEEIHRQARDNPIISLATQTRQQQLIKPGVYGTVAKFARHSKPAITALNRFKEEVGNQDTVILCARNATRVRLNSQVRYTRGFTSKRPVVGERLVCLKNDKEKGLMNGQCAEVLDADTLIEDTAYLLRVLPEGESREVSCIAYAKAFGTPKIATTLREFHKDEAELKELQKEMPHLGEINLFDFGYALSVHKAQGSEWARVALFDEQMPQQSRDNYFRWLYTGITRAKERLMILV